MALHLEANCSIGVESECSRTELALGHRFVIDNRLLRYAGLKHPQESKLELLVTIGVFRE